MKYSVLFLFLFHSAVLFEYLVWLLINVKKKKEKTPVVTQTTKLCNIMDVGCVGPEWVCPRLAVEL